MVKPTFQLSDAQQSAILDASYALPPRDQKVLRERVLARLEAEPEVGDGLVFRICATAQRELWAPPMDAREYGHGPLLFRKSV